MHSIKHFSFLFSCFLMSVLLCACGSKGDLYQPVEPNSEQNTSTQAPELDDTDPNKKQN